MKRAIAYLRVSTKKQDAKRQQEQIEEYCKENNFEIIDIVSEKITGATADREGLIKLMLLDSSAGDAIIMSETSRLSREDDIMALLTRVDQFLKVGLDVIFVDGDQKFDHNKQLSLFEIIQLAFEAKANSDERKKIASRALSGKHSKIKQSCYVGGFLPYGYKTKSNPLREKNSREYGAKIYVIDEEKRKVIETLFDCIANKGLTLQQTAQHLNDLDIDKTGKIWSFSGVNYAAHNKAYTGNYEYGGVTLSIPNIISQELFDKAQLQIKKNRLLINKGNKNFNILKGLLKCPCGHSMIFTQRDNGRRYYNCLTRMSQNPIYTKCNNTGLNAFTLNKIVWEVTKAFLNKTDFKLKTEQAAKDIEEEITLLQKKLLNLEEKFQSADQKIKRTLDILLEATELEKPIIQKSFSELVLQSDKIKKNIKELNTELKGLLQKKSDFEIKFESELIENLTDIEKNDIYKRFIEKIVYYSHTKYKGIIVINFKNGYESVIHYLSRDHQKIYELPQSCSFNPESRKVIHSYNKVDDFNIGEKVIQELDYDDVINTFYLDDMQLEID